MLVLPGAVRDEIVAHAERGGEEEICGVLAGERDEGGSRVTSAHPTARVTSAHPTARVTSAHPTANVAEHPRTRYRIDPEELLSTIESIEGSGRDVVGFYHSHPNGPAEPSATDAQRATWTGYSYVICSLAENPTLGAWRWTGEAFAAEEIVEPED